MGNSVPFFFLALNSEIFATIEPSPVFLNLENPSLKTLWYFEGIRILGKSLFKTSSEE